MCATVGEGAMARTRRSRDVKDARIRDTNKDLRVFDGMIIRTNK